MPEYGKVSVYVTIKYTSDSIGEAENMGDEVHEALRDAAIEPDSIEIELEYGDEING